MLAALGCSRSPYELAPVEGVVTIGGAAFTEGKVMFAPIAKGTNGKAGRAAFGRVDASGHYSLSTYEPGDGCVVGEHWVTILRIPPVDAEGRAIEQPQTGAARKFDSLAVPRKMAVLAGQDNRIDITVTKQEVAKYGMLSD